MLTQNFPFSMLFSILHIAYIIIIIYFYNDNIANAMIVMRVLFAAIIDVRHFPISAAKVLCVCFTTISPTLSLVF